MEQHPLQYFKDLILRNKIINERMKFSFTTDYTPADQQLFIQNNIANPGISQMLSKVNKIQSIPHQDVEDDANIRALQQAQSNGQSMPYTTKQQSINFNGQTIK